MDSKRPLLVIAAALILPACTEGYDHPIQRLLNAPEVREAIESSGFQLRLGTDPPDISGQYWLRGRILESTFGTAGRRLDTVLCYPQAQERGPAPVGEARSLTRTEFHGLRGSGADYTVAQKLSSPSGVSYLLFTGTRQGSKRLMSESLRVEASGSGRWEKGIQTLRRTGDCFP